MTLDEIASEFNKVLQHYDLNELLLMLLELQSNPTKNSFRLADMKTIIKHYTIEKAHVLGRNNFPFTGNKAAVSASFLRLLGCLLRIAVPNQQYRPSYHDDHDDEDEDEDEDEKSKTEGFQRPEFEMRELGPRGLSVYAELRASGFGHAQAVSGIRAQAALNCDYTYDTVMLAIIAAMEGPAADAEAHKDDFNADIDRAILLSEGEREHIEERKRRRLDALESDCSCSLRECILTEFPTSFILGHASLCVKSESCKGLSSSSSSSAGSSKSLTLLKCIDIIETFSCNFYSTSSTACRCDCILKDLRKNIVCLLVEERNSIKWWRQYSYSYLRRVACRLDEVPFFVDLPRGDDMSVLHGKLSCVLTMLKEIVSEIRTALYDIPEVPGSAPKAFIDADPEAQQRKFEKYKIDEDGFEIIFK